jgi:flagellar motor switch protein FliN/FliY
MADEQPTHQDDAQHLPGSGEDQAADAAQPQSPQAGTPPPTPTAQAPGRSPIAFDSPAEEDALLQGDVDYLLEQAEQALESINTATGDPPQGVSAFRLEEFSGPAASTESATFDLIRDVELDLRIELGRTHMYLEDVLKLRKGSVVPLDKLAGDPVDIYVNGRLVARGEVLVLSDNFCVRVAELITGTSISA